MKAKVSVHDDKQLLFCLSIFFLRCLQEYNMSLVPEQPPGQTATSYLLVEGFTGKLRLRQLAYSIFNCWTLTLKILRCLTRSQSQRARSGKEIQK